MSKNPERDLNKEMAAAKALRESISAALGDDADTMRDTIEGETGLHEAVASVMDMIREDEILTIGITGMIEALSARKSRLEARQDRCRSAIEQALLIGEIKTLALPDATVSLKSVPRALEIVDEALIPAEFFKPRDPSLDRSALKAALKEGRDVPGAILDNGGITISIRRS